MKIKQLVGILTASLASLRKEGKFARGLMWKYARPEVFCEIYSEAHGFISKFVRIALIGLFLSFFQESSVIVWIKAHWVAALVGFVIYSISSKMISAFTMSKREKCRQAIGLHMSNLVWEKNQSVGIGTRIGSAYKQKLRTARRCNYYDIKTVGLWPIEALSAVLSSVVLLGTLAFLNWRIGLIFAVTSFLVALVAAYMSQWVREKEKSLQEDEDKSDEYMPASMTVDSTFLGTCRMLFGRSVELRQRLLNEKIRFTRRALLITALAGSFTIVAIAVQLWLARESLFHQVTLVRLGMTISTMAMAIGAFANTMKTLLGDQSSISDIREFQEFFEYPEGESGKDDRSFAMAVGDKVSVVDAEFTYPYVEHAPVVLKGVSLEFEPGEATVIVGANGSGKTTLGYILSNIHRPQKGHVEYGSTVIGGYTTKSVLDHTVVIPQRGDLPDLPLCESLFGTVDMSTVDMGRYVMAIEMTGAKEVLDRMPNGIHTQIGTAFTGGTNPSGGEEQRLRLAAFFYRALDARTRFVIADEPSRYLDPATREKVYTKLISLARDHGKIVIVISHDAELESFDRAIIMGNGRVLADKRGEEIQRVVSMVSKTLAGDSVVSS